MSQKAAQGGIMTKAAIGTRDIGLRDEFGREVRTLETDDERASLVRWAFQVITAGDWTTSQLHKELVQSQGACQRRRAPRASRRLIGP